MDQELSIHDTLVGRTLGRITPMNQDDKHTSIILGLQSREMFHLKPKATTLVHDLLINTMHRAVPINYVTFRPDDTLPGRWTLSAGAPNWMMFQLVYTPADRKRPLDSFELKKVSYA